jgi:hypothetical protein
MVGVVRRTIEDYLGYQEPVLEPERKSARQDAKRKLDEAFNKKPKLSDGKKQRTYLSVGNKQSTDLTAYKMDNIGIAISKDTTSKVKVNYTNKLVTHVQQYQGFTKTGEMTNDQILEVADAVDSLYVGPGYRERLLLTNSKGIAAVDRRFSELYGTRLVRMEVKFEDDWRSEEVLCMPCYFCGLALPLNIIEVDHWYEQTSGKVGALIKVLRAVNMGLTTGDASGKRGPQWSAGGPLKEIPTRNKGTKINDGQINTLRQNAEIGTKQSLSGEGKLFCSVAYGAFSESSASFDNYFVHSLVNLSPACGACNKLKNQRYLWKRP